MLSHFGKPDGLAGLTYCGAPGTLQSACRQPRPPWHCDANREDHMTELDHEVVKPGFVITMLPPWKFTNRCCWLATCLAFYLCILLVKELTKITSPWSYIVHMYILTSEVETQIGKYWSVCCLRLFSYNFVRGNFYIGFSLIF